MPSETQREDEGDSELKITASRLLKKWIQRAPNSLLKTSLLFLAFGAGLGVVLSVSYGTISWLRNRPLPPKTWPIIRFEQAGITARLETEWNDGIHCKLLVEPLDASKADAFGQFVSENRYRRITINLFNSTHFRIWSEDEYLDDFTLIQKEAGKTEGTVKQSCLNYLPRTLYNKAANWEVSTNLPSTVKQESAGEPSTGSQAAQPPSVPLEGDDVVSGYNSYQQRMFTRGGLTFFMYIDDEQLKAMRWGPEEARIHYKCDKRLACTLTNDDTGVVLHAKLRE